MAVVGWVGGQPLEQVTRREWVFDPAPAVLPRVSVIVACYGQLQYTIGLVASLRENAGCEYELTLVANGCRETEAWAKRNDIHCLAFPENRGVPAAYNAGVRETTGELVALWNNDMTVHPGGLRRLAEACYTRGIAAQSASAWDQAGDYLGPSDDPAWSDTAEGYALVFRREVWDQTGEWDETFFPSYCDDSDWIFRARLAGFDYCCVRRCVTHFGQATSASMDLNPTIKRHQGIIRDRYLKLGLGQRLAVLRWGAHGDVVMTTPALRGLKKALPLARLHVHTEPGCGGVLAGLPYVDLRFDAHVDPRKYSRVIDLNHAYEWAQREGRYEHPVRAYCRRAEVEFDGQPYDFRVPPGLRPWAAECLPDGVTLVACGLRSGTRAKQNWSAARWLELADSIPSDWRLVALDSARQPALGPKGPSLDDAGFYAHPQVVDLTGQTPSLQHCGALLERCAAFVGVDSGLLHVASALKQPVVNVCAAAPIGARLPLVGQADGYEGEAPCFPCQYRDPCPEQHCLDWVRGAWVAEKLGGMVG